MPACRLFAETLKTLTIDDPRTLPVIRIIEHVVDTEKTEELEAILLKLKALLQ